MIPLQQWLPYYDPAAAIATALDAPRKRSVYKLKDYWLDYNDQRRVDVIDPLHSCMCALCNHLDRLAGVACRSVYLHSSKCSDLIAYACEWHGHT